MFVFSAKAGVRPNKVKIKFSQQNVSEAVPIHWKEKGVGCVRKEVCCCVALRSLSLGEFA